MDYTHLKLILSKKKRSEAGICTSCLLVLAIIGFLSPHAYSQNGETKAPLPPTIYWTEVEPGYHLARYELDASKQILKSDVFLLKFHPDKFSFHAVPASSIGQEQSDLLTLTRHFGGVAGINAHFFDEKGAPLGLLISESAFLNKMHRGGKLLTGVFSFKNGMATIVHRNQFSIDGVETAIQSGPRLIVQGRRLEFSGTDYSSRRSGIAITKRGEVIIFATLLRFPGAAFSQIQQMLLQPELEIRDALALDGGSSSQLYIEKNSAMADDTFISGGQTVPVGLIVKRRNPQ